VRPVKRLVLASASPQRRAILERLGVTFELRPTNFAELSAGDPAHVALQNALGKVRAASTGDPAETILGVDTLVSLTDTIFGKPTDESHAREMLSKLGGLTHTVFSGLVVKTAEAERTALTSTRVSFRELSNELLEWYLAKHEWAGRAGGYAIQGTGAALVREIDGEYENVVGLPLASLLDLLPDLLLGS
jgi:septum formation protein